MLISRKFLTAGLYHFQERKPKVNSKNAEPYHNIRPNAVVTHQ